MSKPGVSVIVPARDAEPTLQRTLDALRAQTLHGDFEVIVVDDGSHDRTPEIVRGHGGFARLITNRQSLGPGGARNRGAEEAQGPVLAFTDADCFPTPGWLAAGLEAISEAELVQGPVTPDPSVARTPFDRSLVVERPGGFYPTANLFVRRSVFENVGGFRDWVLAERGRRRWASDRRRARASRTPIGEDTLFAWTAHRQGARSAFASEAIVHHAVVPGTLLDDVADRWHWARDMPGLARLVPELRHGTFHRYVFFNEVTARFDCALAGVAAAAVTRRSYWLVAALPYLRHVRNHARQWPARDQLSYLAGAPIVEAATFAALLTGSLAWRSVVL
jgi:glycosyltransferase involved in cell wall biosynthesis